MDPRSTFARSLCKNYYTSQYNQAMEFQSVAWKTWKKSPQLELIKKNLLSHAIELIRVSDIDPVHRY